MVCRGTAACAAAALAWALGGGVAYAQSQQPAPRYKIQPLNLHRERLGSAAFAESGRSRMRGGDCAGAVESFDLALSTSTDPTLHRDRGLCHERLGDVYPAMDDYRYYLAAQPDAADAEGVRQRLAKLEQDTLGHSSAPTNDAPGAQAQDAYAPTDVAHPKDRLETVEHDHEELASPLRKGTGVSLAPFLSAHKWLINGTSFGDSTTWSEAVGLQLRWSIGPQSAFLVEAGYEIFNSTDVATISGLTSQVGYELRIPFDPDYDNQFLLGLGVGYDFFAFSPKDASFSSENGGGVIPRVRLGWRHMFAASVALDVSLDAGVATKALSHGVFLGGGADSQPVEMIGLNAGVAWGM